VDEDLVVRPGVVIPAHELQWRFSRASGPGGQGVNTTDSRVQLSFDLAGSPSVPEPLRARALGRLTSRVQDGVLTVVASDSRSQWQNRRSAALRLSELLRAAMGAPSKPRRATKPTRASVERRLQQKRSRGMTKRLRQAREVD
jgi:ribosome-associated protein